ncbi:MAG: GTPase Era [Balneolaceae bacterium]|nr:GTPase Era [Balneolaceae bacterium]
MTEKQDTQQHKSGYVAIVGKPNAGKSTLMNSILGSKISITTHKPQTTRHQIIGIHSEENLQIIFLDTPGIIHPKYELQKAMMSFVARARNDADIVLFLVEAGEDRMPSYAFDVFKTMSKPIVLVVNKMDTSNREQEREMVDELTESYNFTDTIFISALTGEGIPNLMDVIYQNLKPGPPFYPKDMLSEQPVRFFVAELIREQLFVQFQQEIPYSSTVDVIQYDEREDMDYINAEIIVNRNSQKRNPDR